MSTPLPPWVPLFNEFTRIAPKGSVPFHHVVTEAFGDDLVFSVIEHVTISSLVGVGHMHAYYHRYATDEPLKALLKQYEAKIKEMESHPLKGLSSKPDWYRREGGCLVSGTNDTPTITRLSEGQWYYQPRTPRPEGTKYISDEDSAPLEDDDIKKYLDDYIGKLQELPWFKSAKHHCTIVRPISLRDKDASDETTYIPLGNLYLHFGTQQPRSLEFYQDLVNKLMWVWFRNNGYALWKELSALPTEGDPPHKRYEPQLNEAGGKGKLTTKAHGGKPWHDFFEAAFKDLDADGMPKFASRLIRFDSKMFADLKSSTNPKSDIKDLVTKYLTSVKGKRKLLNGFANPASSDALQAFEYVLNVRRCAQILLYVCKLDAEKVHPMVLARGASDTAPSMAYFSNHLLIPSKDPAKARETASYDEELNLLKPLQDLVDGITPRQ